MSVFSNSIICVCVCIGFLYSSECQVTVSNLNGAGNFPCGHITILECAIHGYGGGMTWKLDGTIIAQCAFGSCTKLSALPSGDIFTHNERAGKFYLIIGITQADNETVYLCDGGSTQNQTTVHIQVPPSDDAFTTDITETYTSITVEAGCFYPSDAGRMDVYCVNDAGTEELVVAAEIMTPTTTGCTGDCAGPNIYTATGSITLNSSNTGGNSRYRFKIYHKDFKQYAISNDSTAIYNCQSQVTVSNLNGTGTFLCGFSTRLECTIPDYLGGMSWKLEGTVIAQCAFGTCIVLGALPSGDIFSYNESAGNFYLTIGITQADNGTQYQCDDGYVQDQTTVNIQVTPSDDAFTTDITERSTSITVEAGCFYPSDAGRMDVYCVNRDGTEELVQAVITMTTTTTGCTGDCAGPNIYTATGSITIDSSNTGGNSRYRFKIYHEDFKPYAISKDSRAIYYCGSTTRTSTSTPTTVTTTSPTSTSTTSTYASSTMDNGVLITITTSIIGVYYVL